MIAIFLAIVAPSSFVLPHVSCLRGVAPVRPALYMKQRIHPGIQSAFEEHSVDDRLDSCRLRRTLSHLGTDVSTVTSTRLVERYGHNRTLTLDALDEVVRTSTVASPVRFFWLVADPRGDGVRSVRRGWNKFGKAGMLTFQRMTHYGVGALSLLVGTVDLVDFVCSFGFQNLDADAAACHGALHTAAAVLSLPRFGYKWTENEPWFLWMPNAREANMWPSFIVFAWYTLAMQSDFVISSEAASFSCNDLWFQGFTWFTSFVLLYGGVRTGIEKVDQNSGVYANRVSNFAFVMATMTVPILGDTLRCSLLSHDPAVLEHYRMIVAQYPEYSHIYFGSLLAAMYMGNLVCALSSAEHHGAITKKQIADLTNLISLSGLVLLPFAALCSVDHGELARSMVFVTLDGMKLW